MLFFLVMESNHRMKLLPIVFAVVQLILAGPLPKEYVANTAENCKCFRAAFKLMWPFTVV